MQTLRMIMINDLVFIYTFGGLEKKENTYTYGEMVEFIYLSSIKSKKCASFYFLAFICIFFVFHPFLRPKKKTSKENRIRSSPALNMARAFP